MLSVTVYYSGGEKETIVGEVVELHRDRWGGLWVTVWGVSRPATRGSIIRLDDEGDPDCEVVHIEVRRG